MLNGHICSGGSCYCHLFVVASHSIYSWRTLYIRYSERTHFWWRVSLFSPISTQKKVTEKVWSIFKGPICSGEFLRGSDLFCGMLSSKNTIFMASLAILTHVSAASQSTLFKDPIYTLFSKDPFVVSKDPFVYIRYSARTHLYRVAKTHRMPYLIDHFLQISH